MFNGYLYAFFEGLIGELKWFFKFILIRLRKYDVK